MMMFSAPQLRVQPRARRARQYVLIALCCVLFAVPGHSHAEEASPAPPAPSSPATDCNTAMSAERLGELILKIDPAAQQQGNLWQFQLAQRPLFLVHDERADRMRIFTPIVETAQLDAALMLRMLQANYDAVLDARYAVAKEIVWSVFIHPLADLSEAQFASALSQVHTAATTFGTSFSSGALIFGGGDSQQEHQRLLESLRQLLSPTT